MRNRHTSIQEGAGDYKKTKTPHPKPQSALLETEHHSSLLPRQMEKAVCASPHWLWHTHAHGLTGTQDTFVPLTSSPLTRRAYFENQMTEVKIWEAC